MIGKVFFIKIFLVLRSNPQRVSAKKNLKKTKLFLNFPYLLGVWVGDKRHFEPYNFDDDIVSIYFRKYILILCCINHYTIAMRDFQESMTKISRQTEGELRPKTTSKGRNLI